jgi:hypothetical protein
MGYAGGITSDYDVQAASDDYLRMPVFYKFKLILRQKHCPVSTSISNNPPAINAL